MVAVDGHFVARIRLRDKLKPGVDAVITALRANGIDHIRLATGDRPSAARAVARHLNLDGFDARMLPDDKVTLVKRLQAEGRRVALVGDGINDAAAMAAANVGIAVSRGAELARATADVALAGEDLMTLITAVRLSREAMALVRQNIGIVAVPNAAALVVATAGGLSPLMATAANNGSTLVAGLNALRPLRRTDAKPRR
jgi:P-type E1-E2 ATPase